jgi:hypothetical protein
MQSEVLIYVRNHEVLHFYFHQVLSSRVETKATSMHPHTDEENGQQGKKKGKQRNRKKKEETRSNRKKGRERRCVLMQMKKVKKEIGRK